MPSQLSVKLGILSIRVINLNVHQRLLMVFINTEIYQHLCMNYGLMY